MIIVKKPGYLIYKKYIFKCSLGKNGIKKKIREGDGITPYGTFKLLKIFYRADRVLKIKTNLKKIKINKSIGWCDDPNSKFYNKQIRLPHNDHHEKLYRNDNIYDVLIVLNYNMKPIIRGKGSAIFIHVTSKKFKPTEGCIALKKGDLLLLLNVIKNNTKIKIKKF